MPFTRPSRPSPAALLSITLVAASLTAAVAHAQSPPAPRLQAVRATSAIVVDGRLDESDWQRAAVATGFTQREPLDGQPASESTEARVLFDDRALYVGIFAAHRNAADIIMNEFKRDFDGASTDWVAVIVDPFLDRRNGYQFGVNPAGAAWDSQKFNDGRERNLSWDGVWSVRTRIAPEGWYAEYEIPFRTLQAPDRDRQTWGINFQRHLQGRLEESFWAPVPRPYQLDRLSLAGTLDGLTDVKPGVNLRVKPYALARADDGASGGRTRADTGVDVKYGMSSSLTADLTVHTDFSQVEADVQQVGATRFSLLFPEKREFFLENSGVFQFGPGGGRAALISAAPGTSAGGRDNSVQNDLALFFSRRIGLSETGLSIPILGGARLSGRAAGTTVGALHVQQQAGGGEAASAFTVLRARRNLFATSDVGAMFVERRWHGAGGNRVAGVDINVRPLDDLLVYGYAAAVLAHRSGDSLGDGRDTSGRLGMTWNDGRWVADGSYSMVGSRFADDSGFVPRSGVSRLQALAGRQFRPARLSRWVREIYPVAGATHLRREHGGFDSRYLEYRFKVTFENGSSIELGDNPNVEDLEARFVVNQRRNLGVEPGRYDFSDRFVSVASSRSRRLTLDAHASHGDYYDGRRSIVQFAVGGRVNTHLSGTVSISRDDVRLPSGAVVVQRTTARVNYGFSTRLFVNALVQHNSDTRQWDSNVRLNFIHRPLSDVFVVFSDRRTSLAPDQRGRAIAVKVTRLFAL